MKSIHKTFPNLPVNKLQLLLVGFFYVKYNILKFTKIPLSKKILNLIDNFNVKQFCF